MKGLQDEKPKEGVGIPAPATLPVIQQTRARLSKTKRILLALVLLCFWTIIISRRRGFFRTELTPEEAEVLWPVVTGAGFDKPKDFKNHHKHSKAGRRFRFLNGRPAEKIFL